MSRIDRNADDVDDSTRSPSRVRSPPRAAERDRRCRPQDSGPVGLSPGLDSEVGRAVTSRPAWPPRPRSISAASSRSKSSDPNQRSLADLLVENSFITPTQARRIKTQIEDRDTSQIPGYQLICRVGKGAMATVYKARQLSLDRIVAVKVLPKKMSENREFVDRFYKEGKAAARLSHNNIVQAIDVGYSPKGYHYFVMEYIEGKTLYDMMVAAPAGRGARVQRGRGAGHHDPDGRRPGPLPRARADPPRREAQEHHPHLRRRGQADRPGPGPRDRRPRGGPIARPARPTAPRTTSAPSRSAATWTSISGPTSIRWARRCTTW